MKWSKSLESKRRIKKELEGIDLRNIVSRYHGRSTFNFIPPSKPKKSAGNDDDAEDHHEDTENEDDEAN